MKVLNLIILILLVQSLFGQSVNWSQTRNWKLFDIHDNNAFSYTLDTLQHFKSASLDSSKMQDFLKSAIPLPKNQIPLWMGLYVCTCSMKDGSVRKIDISVYAGFFFEEWDKSYYSVPKEVRDVWLHYFHDNLAKLSLGDP